MAQIEKKQKMTDVKVSVSDMTMLELIAKSKQISSEIAKKKLDRSVGRLKNIREIFHLRKSLARVKTELNIKSKLNSVKS